jgi:hypothetical protein
MSHLSPAEFVDLAEDTLSSSRLAHAETCEACRAQAVTVRAALSQAAAVDTPEPSPLFWEHFQARVREGVAQAPPPSIWEWLSVRAFTPLPAAAAVILAAGIAMFGGGRLMHDARGRVAETTAVRTSGANPAVAPAVVVDSAPSSTVDQDEAAVWAVLTAAAADLGLDEAHDAGMHTPPATIDRAVQSMTPDELNELGRLLQRELKRPTS